MTETVEILIDRHVAEVEKLQAEIERLKKFESMHPPTFVELYHTIEDLAEERRVKIETLRQTLEAWKTKIQDPDTPIEWFSSDSGEWTLEHFSMDIWGIEVPRRIKPESVPELSEKGNR